MENPYEVDLGHYESIGLKRGLKLHEKYARDAESRRLVEAQRKQQELRQRQIKFLTPNSNAQKQAQLIYSI